MKLTTAHLRRIIQEEVALIIHESAEDATMASAVDELLKKFPEKAQDLLNLLQQKAANKQTPAANPGTKRVILSPEEISAIRAQASLR